MRLSDMTFEQYQSVVANDEFWNNKINSILVNEGFEPCEITRFKEGSNIVYSYDKKYVVKLFPIFYKEEFVREVAILQNLDLESEVVEVPKLVRHGNFEGWDYIIMTELRGELLIDLWEELSIEEKKLLSSDLGRVIREFHNLPVEKLTSIGVDWKSFIQSQLRNMKSHHEKHALKQKLFDDLENYLDETYINYHPDKSLLTGEYTPFNLLLNKVDGKWKLTGVIDFADGFLGDPEYDLLGPILFMFNIEESLVRNFLLSYGYHEGQLNESFRKKLMIYTILHRFSNIPYFISKKEEAQHARNFDELANILLDF